MECFLWLYGCSSPECPQQLVGGWWSPVHRWKNGGWADSAPSQVQRAGVRMWTGDSRAWRPPAALPGARLRATPPPSAPPPPSPQSQLASAAESHLCLSPRDIPNWEPPGVGDHPDTVKIARQLLSELWAGCLHGHGLGWAPGLPDTARAPAAADKCPALLISPTLSPALPQTCVHTGVHSSLESKGGEPPQPAPQTAEPDASRQLGATGASCWLPCSLAPGGAFLEELNIKVVSPPKL